MSSEVRQRLDIAVGETQRVSALLQVPAGARAAVVLAHGAGAGMEHPFLAAMAEGLMQRGLATLRYQFLYLEQGGKRPDPPSVAHTVVRAAVAEAVRQLPGLPIFAGGKSFGGRMTSQAQAAAPLSGVRGLVFLGFPLHPAEKPSADRAKHLRDVTLPMLFLQGTRDKLADASLMAAVGADLGARASLHWVADADHAFHVPARTGRKDADVRNELMDTIAAWIDAVIG